MLKQWSLESVHYSHGYQNIEKSDPDVHVNFSNWLDINYGDKKIKIVLATDHGSVRVNTPCKIVGDKQTTANLRYKHGRNLDYDAKDVLAFKDPTKAGLPVPTVNSSYVFAKEDGFLCYPNNYNHFVGYYKNTFQHGGISLEEMIVPVIKMVPKGN